MINIIKIWGAHRTPILYILPILAGEELIQKQIHPKMRAKSDTFDMVLRLIMIR